MKPAAVRRLEPPPHATPQITNALRRPHRERRGCSSPTSATDLRHVHLLPIARLPECSVHFRSPNPTNGVASAGTPGRFAFDDAIRASVDPSLTRSAIWRSRAPLNPGGLRYRRALEGAPPVPRRFLPRARSARRPLTPPVATCSGSFDPPPAARTAFPQSPAKGPASVRSEAPSLDECPLDAPPPFRETTNLEREPATGLGALPPFNPASDALSPPRSGEEVARPRPLPRALHARALLATRRSSTSAIETICKHDLRTSKPGDTSTVPREQFRLRDEGCPAFAELLLILGETDPRSNWPSSLLHDDDSIEREPRIHGSGAVECIAIIDCVAGLLRDDGSSWRLRPNPIGSNTSCRATRVDYDRSTVIESSSAPAKPCRTNSRARPRGHRLRSGFRGGPPPAPLREKEMRSAAPEVLSVTGLPLAGSARFPQLVPNLWKWWARAFSIFAPDRARTVRRGLYNEDSASLRRMIATLRRGPNTRTR